MVRVSIADRPLTATAALVWNGDLPRLLQQILFDTADGATPPAPKSLPALADHKLAAGCPRASRRRCSRRSHSPYKRCARATVAREVSIAPRHS